MVQRDGRIVVAANLHTLARFTNAGMLDPTFGFHGRVLPATDSQDASVSDEGLAQMILQPDGEILLGGFTDNESQLITLAR